MSTQMLRTFIAVRIAGNAALTDLYHRLGQFGEPFRPIPVNQLHVTLKFLGATEASKLDEISGVTRQVAARHVRHNVVLRGLGAFPSVRRPSVIWVGIGGNEVLEAMTAELEAALDPFGFAPERRPFQPHLTVLRIKSRPPPALFQMLDDWSERDFGVAPIHALEFYQSELQRGGSRYTVLASAPLGEGRGRE